jgi:hypothetical protein
LFVGGAVVGSVTKPPVPPFAAASRAGDRTRRVSTRMFSLLAERFFMGLFVVLSAVL